MSLEEQIAKLTAAVEANTAAHTKLAEVAMSASAGKRTEAEKPAPKEEDDGEDDAAAAKKKAAAKKAAETRKANASKKKAEEEKEAPTLDASVTSKDLMAAARAFMSPDDADQCEENKERFASALKHLGAAKLSAVDEEDIPKLAGYIAYWQGGLDVDFEEIDGLIAELVEANGGGSMLD